MSNNEYNGWSNYETWCVKLWIDNEQHLQEHWLERAGAALEEGEGARNLLAAELREWLDDQCGDAAEQLEGYGMLIDLLRSAMSEADAYEVAESFLDDARELAEDAA